MNLVFTSMSRPYRYILLISILITTVLFVLDSIYDKPPEPYPLAKAIKEMALAGSVYTTIIFGLIAGIYYAVKTG